MAQLIQTLQHQHVAIQAAAAAVQGALTTQDPQRVRAAVSHLTALLKAHLALEDEQLYPALSSAVEAGHDHAALLRAYEKHMATISLTLNAFLERHAGSQLELKVFESDWPMVCRMLQDRISNEEETLYPLYVSRAVPRR